MNIISDVSLDNETKLHKWNKKYYEIISSMVNNHTYFFFLFYYDLVHIEKPEIFSQL